MQVAAMHVLLVQTRLSQSWLTAHDMRLLHAVQTPPPQSTSVSFPFDTPSLHDGATHTRPRQAMLVQSLAFAHFLPSPHAIHTPPQSTSVSCPFARPSLHVGAAHVLFEQTWLAQSLLLLQVTPLPHLGHGPPQSSPVSLPLRRPSEHDENKHV